PGASNTTDGAGESNETDDGVDETDDTTGDDQVNQTDSPNNDTRPADDTGPGFGVALAGAVVVLTAALLAGRRVRNG
ncbi:MAG: 3-oxoacyl-(acyl-carrier-protein) synthase, partial [Halovenus sp.]